MYIFNTLGSCYCLLKQWSAYIINSSACIINVWGYTEIFLPRLKKAREEGKIAFFSKPEPDKLFIDGQFVPL